MWSGSRPFGDPEKQRFTLKVWQKTPNLYGLDYLYLRDDPDSLYFTHFIP